MAITYGTPSSASNTGTSIVCPAPTGLTADTWSFAFIAAVITRQVVTPADWTLVAGPIDVGDAAAGAKLNCYRRKGIYTEATTFTFVGGTGRGTVVIHPVFGLDGTSPLDANPTTNVDSVSDTNYVAAGITTVTGTTTATDGADLLCAWHPASATAAITITPPSGMTQRSHLNPVVSGVLLVASEARPSAGATGTRTATSTVAALSSALTLALRPVGAAASGPTFATHPYASTHATVRGRQLLTAQVWQGQIYFGYGDTEAGTSGGVKLASLDPATAVWTLRGTMNSDEAFRLRTRPDGFLMAPFADPIGTEGNEYAILTTAHAFTVEGPVGTSFNHCFDYAYLSSTVPVILAGQSASTGNPRIVEFRNGAWVTAASPAFVQDTRLVNGVSTSHTWSRFYNVGVLNGLAYVSMGGGYVSSDWRTTQLDAGFASFVRQTDGTWTQTGPVLGGFTKPLNFAGALVYRADDGRLLSFNGTTVTTRRTAGCVDHYVEGTRLYVLRSNSVEWTTDLISWNTLSAVPPINGTSMAVIGEDVFVGTADSRVVKLVSTSATSMLGMGINIHMSYFSSNYGDGAQVATQVNNLGLLWVRDQLVTTTESDAWYNTVFNKWRNIYSVSGAKVLMITGKPTQGVAPGPTIDFLLNKLAPLADEGVLGALEGPNEWDTFSGGYDGWWTDLRTYTQELWNRAKAHPNAAIRDLPIVGPALAGLNQAKADSIGDLSAWVDKGAIHFYIVPGTSGSSLTSTFTHAATMYPGRPIWVTETGCNTSSYTEAQQDERFLTGQTAFDQRGAERVFYYELIDLYSSPVSQANRYGSMRTGFVWKPVASSIQGWSPASEPASDPTPPSDPPPADTTRPSVTIKQAIGQSDPTSGSTILFDVVFSEPVTGFGIGDVVLSGTAGATTVVTSGSGTTYTVSVSGMTTTGTVIATIPVNAAQDAAGNLSFASTSTDNTVTYNAPAEFSRSVSFNDLSYAFNSSVLPFNDSKPTVVSISGNGSIVEVIYNEQILGNPAPSSFNLIEEGVTKTIQSLSTSGDKLTLILNTYLIVGSSVSLSYTVPEANPITDLTGSTADAFTAYSVSNNTVTYVPNPPVIQTAVAGNELATVSFSPPTYDGGSAITSYTVTSSPEGLSATGSSSPLTVLGLTNGTFYNFTVTATNSVGTSAPSEPSNTVTPAALPGQPIIISVTPGNQQVIISFDPPVSNGGSPITQYEYISTPGDIQGQVTSSPITVTGLTNGVSYTFKVRAINSIGTGPYSEPSASVTPAAAGNVPGAPTNVTASKQNGAASVSFSSPSDGGSPITSYTVTSTPGNIIATGTASPVLISGLTNGTSYTFTVKATNANGTGPASSPSNAVTPSAVPDAPVIISVSPGNQQVIVSFNAPASDGGSPVTSYVVTSSPGDITVSGSASPLTVASLTNGVSYTFTAKAINANGSSVASGASNPVTPTASLTVPGPPTGVNATAGNGQAIISFNPPASNGGSVITNYTVTSTPGGLVGTGASSPIIVSGLTNGTPYTFRVSATNAQGTGALSIASNAVTPLAFALIPSGTKSGIVVVACDMFGAPIAEIVGATVKDLQWELNAPGSAKVSIDPLSPAARHIKINEMELQIWINDELRHWVVPRSVQGDSTSVEFACEGIMSHLIYRYVVTSLLYESIDQVAIGWNLVNYAQTGINMDRSIDSASYPLSGVPRSRNYKAEEKHNVLDLLQEFPELNRGFDFDIALFPDGRREWTPYFPAKGSFRNNLAIEWGRNIVNFKYNKDGTEQGTHVYATGGTDTNGARVEENFDDAVLSAKYGRLHRIVSEGNQLDRTWLLDKATEEVRANGNPLLVPEVTVKNDPVQLDGVLTQGDIVPVRIQHNVCTINDNYRIVKIKRLETGNLVLTFNSL